MQDKTISKFNNQFNLKKPINLRPRYVVIPDDITPEQNKELNLRIQQNYNSEELEEYVKQITSTNEEERLRRIRQNKEPQEHVKIRPITRRVLLLKTKEEERQYIFQWDCL